MQDFPFNIPQSLASFNDQFSDDPDKAIVKLRKHLKKRGPDAVGHFLLSWFYHCTDQQKEAIRAALKAKTFAPGSPLMEHLHYFLIHPEKFEAAVPKHQFHSKGKGLKKANRSPRFLDLDQLIALLEEVESHRIQIPEEGEPYDSSNLAEESETVDDVISATLASIHASQGRVKEAIEMYEKLIENGKGDEKNHRNAIKKLKSKNGKDSDTNSDSQKD